MKSIFTKEQGEILGEALVKGMGRDLFKDCDIKPLPKAKKKKKDPNNFPTESKIFQKNF